MVCRCIRAAPKAIASAKCPAAIKRTRWMPGVWPTRSAWMAHTGNNRQRKTRCSKNCAYCAGMRWRRSATAALIARLRQSLYDYYPAALEAFDDWTMLAAWAFVIAFPTPEVLAKAGKRNWEKFLHVHKLARPATCQRRLEIFARAQQFAGSEAAIRAKSKLAPISATALRKFSR